MNFWDEPLQDLFDDGDVDLMDLAADSEEDLARYYAQEQEREEEEAYEMMLDRQRLDRRPTADHEQYWTRVLEQANAREY